MTGGIGKDEDSLRMALLDPSPLQIVRTYAGWIVSTPLDTIEGVPPEHLALMGQVAARRPAIVIDARAADGTEIQQSYTVEREQLAELIMELVSTFLDREMFKQLVAVLPEDWSR